MQTKSIEREARHDLIWLYCEKLCIMSVDELSKLNYDEFEDWTVSVNSQICGDIPANEFMPRQNYIKKIQGRHTYNLPPSDKLKEACKISIAFYLERNNKKISDIQTINDYCDMLSFLMYELLVNFQDYSLSLIVALMVLQIKELQRYEKIHK